MKRFSKINPWLRIAVGMIFEPEKAPVNIPEGVIVHPTPAEAKFKKFYLPMPEDANAAHVELTVPPELAEAPFGEILFHKNRPGALIRLGRNGEEEAFDFRKSYYLPLRIYPKERKPNSDWKFNPVYIRADHGEDIDFLCLKTQWEGNKILITVEEANDKEIPDFLGELIW